MIRAHKMITKIELKTWMLGGSSLNKFERCIVFCHIAFIGVVIRVHCFMFRAGNSGLRLDHES